MSRSDDRVSGRRDDRGGAEGAAADAMTTLAGLLGGDTRTSRTFITGLIAGALVGAVVAGGQLLRGRGAPYR